MTLSKRVQQMAKQGFQERTETERLVLRCYRSEDAVEISQLVQENRAQLGREFAQMAGLQSIDDARAFTAEKQDQWNGGKTFCYGIWRKQVSEQIGQIQLKNISWEIPSVGTGVFH